MPGRKLHPVWKYYEREVRNNGKNVKGICNSCKSVVQAIPSRLEKHLEICAKHKSESGQITGTKRSFSAMKDSSQEISQKRQKLENGLSKLIVRTTDSDIDAFNLSMTRFIIATNAAFSLVDNQYFRKFCSDLRPGVKLAERHKVAGPLLDTIYEEEREKAKSKNKAQEGEQDITMAKSQQKSSSKQVIKSHTKDVPTLRPILSSDQGKYIERTLRSKRKSESHDCSTENLQVNGRSISKSCNMNTERNTVKRPRPRSENLSKEQKKGEEHAGVENSLTETQHGVVEKDSDKENHSQTELHKPVVTRSDPEKHATKTKAPSSSQLKPITDRENIRHNLAPSKSPVTFEINGGLSQKKPEFIVVSMPINPPGRTNTLQSRGRKRSTKSAQKTRRPIILQGSIPPRPTMLQPTTIRHTFQPTIPTNFRFTSTPHQTVVHDSLPVPPAQTKSGLTPPLPYIGDANYPDFEQYQRGMFPNHSNVLDNELQLSIQNVPQCILPIVIAPMTVDITMQPACTCMNNTVLIPTMAQILYQRLLELTDIARRDHLMDFYNTHATGVETLRTKMIALHEHYGPEFVNAINQFFDFQHRVLLTRIEHQRQQLVHDELMNAMNATRLCADSQANKPNASSRKRPRDDSTDNDSEADGAGNAARNGDDVKPTSDELNKWIVNTLPNKRRIVMKTT